ncbi:MAG: hypothetical protein LAT65_07750 [Saccharospirillum sp.]|nr:hypothetical protein [Saccharospirillum sp.]
MNSKILVSDTNIWIDLQHSGLLEAVFRLPHQFVTTEFVWRELRKPPGKQLTDLGLGIEVISSRETLMLFDLKQTLNNYFLADVSCYFIALERGWALLTNDGALRKSGHSAEMEVRGVLWILDELEQHQILSHIMLADALNSMPQTSARLPNRECQLV